MDGGYDGSGVDVMARFLESKSGYCVHYAGTMAVMARAAGIPSRMAIGYTPGSPTGNTSEGPGGTELREFVVDSRNAHSWPELYFEGVGWVQFEPTPSRGVVPTYAQQSSSPVGPRADDGDTLNPGAIPDANGQTSPATEPPSTGGSTQSTGPQNHALSGAGFLAVVGITLLALFPLFLRIARTKVRRQSVVENVEGGSHGAATAAWAETTEIAGDLGYPLNPTDTPRTFAERLATNASLRGEPATSLSRLKTAYEHEEYSNHGLGSRTGESTGAQPPAVLVRPAAALRWADVDAVTRALRHGSSWSTRLKARLFPQSLLNRFRDSSRR